MLRLSVLIFVAANAGVLGQTARAQTLADPQSSGDPSILHYQVTGDHCIAPGLPIPDDPGPGVAPPATSELSIEGTGQLVQDLSVGVEITHTWVGDLAITLESEGGVSVEVFHQFGNPQHACSRDDIDATFSDDADFSSELACNPTPPAIAGELQPDSPLATFNGLDFDGTWTLRVVDEFQGDVGTLVRWCLTNHGLDTGGGTGGTPTPATSAWGLAALIGTILGGSLFLLRKGRP